MAKKKVVPTTDTNVERKCITCAFSKLIQYFKNPVLAECPTKDPSDRQVANVIRACPFYMMAQVPKTVEQRNSYEIK